MMIGSPCSPCCSSECVFVIELQGMETAPFIKTVWHPSAFNGVFAKREETPEGPTLKCLTTAESWGCGPETLLPISVNGMRAVSIDGQTATLKWPGPIRLRLKQAATSFTPPVPAQYDIESVLLEIRPKQNFSTSAPEWDVFEIGDGSELLLPNVVARLFRATDQLPTITVFSPAEDYPIVYTSAFNGYYHDISDPLMGLGEYDFTLAFSATFQDPETYWNSTKLFQFNTFKTRVGQFVSDVSRTFTRGPVNVDGRFGGGPNLVVNGQPQYVFNACTNDYFSPLGKPYRFYTPSYRFEYEIDFFPNAPGQFIYGGPDGFLRGVQTIAQLEFKFAVSTRSFFETSPRFFVYYENIDGPDDFKWFSSYSYPQLEWAVVATNVQVDERGYLVNVQLSPQFETPIRSLGTYTDPFTGLQKRFTGTIKLETISIVRQ